MPAVKREAEEDWGKGTRTHSLPREPRAKKVGRPKERTAKGSELDKGWCRHERGLNDSESC